MTRLVNPKSFQKLALLVIIFKLCFIIIHAGNHISAAFTAVRPGEIPLAGIWRLATVTTTSAMRCADKCWTWNHNDKAGCGGFLFSLKTCNISMTLPGTCQLLQFFEIASIVFGPAGSYCQQFYASTSPVTPSKTGLNTIATKLLSQSLQKLH